MGEQATLAKACLCFQYAEKCTSTTNCANVVDINEGGALVPPDKDGKCESATYIINAGTGGADDVY